VTVALAHLSRFKGEADLQRLFHCGTGGGGLAIATAAEHLRSTLYGAAMLRSNRHASAKVHTTRLLSNARRVLDLMMPSDRNGTGSGRDHDNDFAAIALNALGQIGDAVDTGNGQWLGGPTRLLAVEGVQNLLLIGSLPHALAEQVLGHPVFCAGASRVVDAQACSRNGIDDVVIPMTVWFGSQTNLALWTEAVLADHATRMRDENGSPVDQLEIYAPDVLRSQRRPGRWIPADQTGSTIDGIRLCRPRMDRAQRYNLPHFLGMFEFREGHLVMRRYVTIAHELTLRVRFGLDQRLRAPRAFAITLDKQVFVIDKPPRLPEPEQRIYAFGWEEHSGEIHRHAFDLRVLPFVLHTLKGLLITPTIRQGPTT
jgi:hypothetical protein